MKRITEVAIRHTKMVVYNSLSRNEQHGAWRQRVHSRNMIFRMRRGRSAPNLAALHPLHTMRYILFGLGDDQEVSG